MHEQSPCLSGQDNYTEAIDVWSVGQNLSRGEVLYSDGKAARTLRTQSRVMFKVVCQTQSFEQVLTCKLLPSQAAFMQSSSACCHKPGKATWTADLCFLGRAVLGPSYSMPAASTDEFFTMHVCRAAQILLSAVPGPQAQISIWAALATAGGAQCATVHYTVKP